MKKSAGKKESARQGDRSWLPRQEGGDVGT